MIMPPPCSGGRQRSDSASLFGLPPPTSSATPSSTVRRNNRVETVGVCTTRLVTIVGRVRFRLLLGTRVGSFSRNVRRTARPGAHEGVRRQVPRGFPVFSCRGGRCGPAVTGAVQPMRPAAGLPIRLRPGPTRRRSSACAAARPGPPRGHGSRRSGLRRRSRAPSAAAASAGPTTRR
jgi:hypothetical protein